jgi:hypothetical protein
LRCVLHAIERAENLKTLKIAVEHLPLNVLAAMLQQASSSSMETLELVRVKIGGILQHSETLQKVMLHLPSLHRINLYWCKPDNRDDISSLQPVVEALTASSANHNVSLSLLDTRLSLGTDWSSSALKRLCHISTIRELDFRSLGELFDDHIVAMAKALETNSKMRKLSVDAQHFNQRCGVAVGKMLGYNATLLEMNWEFDMIDLDLHNVRPIAEALRGDNNTTLRKLSLLTSGSVSHEVESVFATVMKSNCTLHHLMVEGMSSSLKQNDEINMYLRLNQCGRSSLLRCGQNEKMKWLNFLIQNRHDLNILFCAVTQNPSICISGNNPRQRKQNSWLKRKSDHLLTLARRKRPKLWH